MTTLKTIILSAAAATFVCTTANAQTMRASCDNRNGTTFADVTDSNDPTEAGYNVDPSEIFRTFANIGFPVSQTNAGNSATANLWINSRFIGANPGSRITGYLGDSQVSASATRSNLQVRARSSDNQSVCFDVSGASVANPLRIRLRGALNITGGSTGLLRLRNPSAAVIHSSSINTGFNRVLALTANGTYTLDQNIDTGMINITTGTGTQNRTAAAIFSLTCVADFNGSGTITVQDIFDFLAAYFAGDLAADCNSSGNISVQDIFDFLAVYFSGCV